MTLLIGIFGSVPIDGSNATPLAAGVCRDVARALEQQGARMVSANANSITLRVPFVRGYGDRWDFVTPLDRIELRIEPIGGGQPFLRYRLSYLRTVLLSVAIPPALGLLVGATGATAVYMLVAGWIWLIAVNCGISWFRARPFFAREVKQSVSARSACIDAPTAT